MTDTEEIIVLLQEIRDLLKKLVDAAPNPMDRP
jgi:hypothetical protein